jgi:hypothetical protein
VTILRDRLTAAPAYGSVQRCFSAGLGDLAFPAAGTVLGASSPMRISVTPPGRCWWIVEACILQRATAGTWVRSDWALILTPADLNGRTTVQCANGLEQGGNYNSDSATTSWYLERNVAYTCEMRSAINGGTFYYMQEVHTTLFGYTTGEGYD